MKKKFILFAFLPFVIGACSTNQEPASSAAGDASTYTSESSKPTPVHTHRWSEYKYDATGHYKECLDCGEKSTKEAHEFGDWIIDNRPTCTEEGTRHKNCKVCDYVEHAVAPVKDHNWEGFYTVDRIATCSQEGFESRHCHDCDETTDGRALDKDSTKHIHTYDIATNYTAPTCTSSGGYYATTYCEDCGTKLRESSYVSLPGGHQYGAWTETVHPTPSNTGLRTRTCEVCGHVDSETIAALNCHLVIRLDNVYLVNDDTGRILRNVSFDGYFFGSDGRLIGTDFLLTIDGNTYYLLNNMIYHGFIVFNNVIYYFDIDGIMFTNGSVNGFDLNGDGIIDVVDFDELGVGSLRDNSIIQIIINGVEYDIYGGVIITDTTLTVHVNEADEDTVDENNTPLYGAYCVLELGEEVYTAYTDFDGLATFTGINRGVGVLTVSLDGYHTREVEAIINRPFNDMTVSLDDSDVDNSLSGRILIADTDNDLSNNEPLVGATLTLTRVGEEGFEPLEIVTDSDGYYIFEHLRAGVYELAVNKTGYIPVRNQVSINRSTPVTQNIAIEAIPSESTQPGYVEGIVNDATVQGGKGIADIHLLVREGINVTTGPVVAECYSDFDGVYDFRLEPGNYTIQAIDDRSLSEDETRYNGTYISTKVLSGSTTTNQIISMSPVIGGGDMRIVLTWGSSPDDLDSHVFFDDGTHVYFSNKTSNYGNLDVDDTTSYGPETITITDGSHSFSYGIHDYSNRNSSSTSALANSGAIIKVYYNNQTYTYNVPSGSGNYWTVFSYNANTGAFTVTNQITYYNPLSN